MRKLLIYILPFLLMSCANMHDPILHSGGMIKFIPHVKYEVDSIIIDRMQDYYLLEWSEDMFYKEFDDFHIKWWNNENSCNIDFINESEQIKSPYGGFDIVWHTNDLGNNFIDKEKISTEQLSDTINKIPDYVFSRKNKIYVKENIHDYETNEREYLQIFEDTLLQRTFLYLVQITLKNNNNRVKKAGNFLINGLASGFDMVSETNYGNTGHIFSTKMKNDVITGKFISFGIRDCNPYNFRNKFRNGLCEYELNNKLYITIEYSKGGRVIEIDVSDQIALQPTGGLILVELDIDDYPEINNEITDPFGVLVDDYENTQQYYN